MRRELLSLRSNNLELSFLKKIVVKFFSLLLCVLVSIYSCESQKISNSPKENYDFKTGEFHVNNCFKDLFVGYTSLDDEMTGNIKLVKTAQGNFYKYTAINDSELVFSCGRGNKEVFIEKYSCSEKRNLPELIYENHTSLMFYTKAGSDTWMNHVIHFSPDSVYQAQVLHLDTLHGRFVDFIDNYTTREACFFVHDMEFKTTDTLTSNYYKFRADGVPSLNISNVSLRDFTLFYSVRLSNDSLVRDSLIIR